MADTDDYLKRYREQNSTDNYYDLAKKQEFKVLLDKEVALENAKANAVKYTNNSINARGFGGTGYGSSLNAGIYNNYVNRAMEVQNTYHDNVANLDLAKAKEEESKANDRFQSVTTMLQGADSTENMDKMLTDYGYGSIDENNVFNWNAEKPQGMSDDDWYQMQYYYRMKKNDFDKIASEEARVAEEQAQEEELARTIGTQEGLANFFATQSGETDADGNPKQKFEAETKTLWSQAVAGNINKGGVVKVTNGEKQIVYVRFNGNGFVKSSQEEYENAGNQYTLERNYDNGKKNIWKRVK